MPDHCPVPVVDLRGLRDDSLPPNYQPLLCAGLDAVIEVRELTGVDAFPWIYEEVNPFKAPPSHFVRAGEGAVVISPELDEEFAP